MACYRWRNRWSRRCGVTCGPRLRAAPTKQGWRLGRTVRSLELLVIAGQVPGVSDVNGLFLFTPLSSGGYQQIHAE